MGGVVRRYITQRFGTFLPSWVIALVTPPWVWVITAIFTVIPWAFGALVIFFLVTFVALFFLGGVQPAFSLQPIALPPFANEWLDAEMSLASMHYHVPMQLLAGDAKQESNFNINATNYSNGSHAQGMFQFEPQTWSGWSDPYTNNTITDTNASRITKFGGYGIDAPEFIGKGIAMSPSYEPLLSQGVSFPADPVGVTTYKNSKGQWISNYQGYENWPQVNFSHFSGANNPPWRIVRSQQGALYTVPYASPFDPVDALYSAANYFSRLYQESGGSWTGAIEGYYGGPGAHGTAAKQYAQSVLQNTWNYMDNTPVLRMPDGAYFPFGWFDFTVTKAKGKDVLNPELSLLALQGRYISQKGYDYFPWLASIPVVMPVGGQATWIQRHGTTTITLPLPSGKTMKLVTQNADRWEMPNGTEANLPAGAVLGTISLGVVRLNKTYPVVISPALSSWLPMNKMLFRLPDGQVAKGDNGQEFYDPAILGKVVNVSR